MIYGHSLGDAITIDLASNHSDEGGLVAETTFTSINDIARFKNLLTRALPLEYLLRHEFDSLTKVRERTLPTALFVHGENDSKVPCYMCTELYEAARGPSKSILLLKDGEHANHNGSQPEYVAKMATSR